MMQWLSRLLCLIGPHAWTNVQGGSTVNGELVWRKYKACLLCGAERSR